MCTRRTEIADVRRDGVRGRGEEAKKGEGGEGKEEIK